MVRQERFANNATSTLNGGISGAVTTVNINSLAGFPLEGDYRIAVEAEIMLVTARSGGALTVVRGIEGSTAVGHADNADVAIIITKAGIDKYITDFIDPYAFDRPPNRLLNQAGTVLTSSDFTQGNFGTSSVLDDATGGITLKMESRAAPNGVGLYKTAPATPYTLTCHVLTGVGANDSADNANLIGFRESSSSKLSFIAYHHSNDSWTQYLDDFATTGTAPANSSQENTPVRADYWLRIEDDGTNLIYYKSADGYNWWQQHTELRGFHFDTGPDEIWWGGDNQGADDQMIHLLAWIEE